MLAGQTGTAHGRWRPAARSAAGPATPG